MQVVAARQLWQQEQELAGWSSGNVAELKKVLAEGERNGLSELCKSGDVIIMGVSHGVWGKMR